jgi:hypothetical protein
MLMLSEEELDWLAGRIPDAERSAKGAYEETVHLARKAKALLLRLGLDNERSATIARLRREHKIKRNFIALAPLGRARLRGGTTPRHWAQTPDSTRFATIQRAWLPR